MCCVAMYFNYVPCRKGQPQYFLSFRERRLSADMEDGVVFPTPNRGLLCGARDVWVIVPDSIRLGQTSRTLGWGGVETNVYKAEYRTGYNAKIIISVNHKVVEN